MKRICAHVAAALTLLTSFAFAQGADGTLALQGLDQRLLLDVRSRGMGGAVLAAGKNASVLFVNPASLAGISSIELRVAGIGMTTSQRQTQEWVPNRLYTGLSLMMEDKWGDINTPATTDPWEQLQKPFDTIGPNWSRKNNQLRPLSLALAMPVQIAEIPVVFGIGGSRAIDLDHFFQNNNVTDPLLGRYRPTPIRELTASETLRVRWYQFTRKREGSIWGVTPAVGVSFSGLSIGASGTYYTGSSDDVEQRLDRGFLTFSYNRFRIQDTVKYASARTGSSTYSGFGGTLAVKFEQPRFSVAATLQLPYTLKRKYTRTFRSTESVLINRASDSSVTTTINLDDTGTENIRYPLTYSLGVLLKPSDRWAIAFDYDVRRLDRVEYTLNDGTMSRPWVDGASFRVGAEYSCCDGLALRAGYREVPQAFSPDGAALIGDPAVMTVLSFGAGLNLLGIEIDAAYEYANLKYQDLWQSNVNYNTLTQHRVMLEFGYKLFEETKQ
ncbi:MAG: outer membrane protein transport protein [Ignavibacteriae bacterium]|nr:outer membrane protein transport protein [Ignavibacteriota bacterium]